MASRNDHDAVFVMICMVHDETQARIHTETSDTMPALFCTYRIYYARRELRMIVMC
jgi:hypothetical protein